MPPGIIRYPLDPTGLNPDNHVQDEVKVLVNRTFRAIAPTYGAYYTESLVVRDITNSRVLSRDVSYQCIELYEIPSEMYGKEICALVLITDPTVSANVSISYQAVGGEFGESTQAIVDMLEVLALDNRPANWDYLINRPSGFNPALHLHDIGDLYGFEFLVHAISELRNAILVGDNASHNRIYQYIDSKFAGLTGGSNSVFTANLDELFFFTG